jgi:hypothetical protein
MLVDFMTVKILWSGRGVTMSVLIAIHIVDISIYHVLGEL